MRTDIHRTSQIVPADYEYVGQECFRPEEWQVVLQERQRIQAHMASTGGRYASVETTGNCMVCGSVNAIYTSLFYHAKSNTYVRMGTDCTENVFRSDFGASIFRKRIQDAREAQAGKRKAQAILGDLGLGAAWDHYTSSILDRVPTWHETKASELVGKLVQYGNLSEKQVNFLRNLMTSIANAPAVAAKRAEEKALAADCPSGRVQVTGVVLTTKEVESQFGWATKMLVKDDRGFTVWGTMPAGLGAVKGDRVSFYAAIEVAREDPKHGFYKRPTKAVMLTDKPAQQVDEHGNPVF